MSLDGLNLAASTVAAVLAAVGLGYQVWRDRKAGIPAFLIRVENTSEEGRTRLVVASSSAGDGTWSISAIEAVSPEGATLFDAMSPSEAEGRRLIVHPPYHFHGVTGVYALEILPRQPVPLTTTRFALRLTLRNFEGRAVQVMAYGHQR